MMMRPVVCLLVFLLSVASICVEGDPNPAEEDDLKAGTSECPAGTPPTTGKCSSLPGPTPPSAPLTPGPANPKGDQDSGKASCPDGEGSDDNCRSESADTSCSSTPSDSTDGRTCPQTAVQKPNHDQSGGAADGPTDERGTVGSGQVSDTHTGSGPVSPSAHPTASPPSQSTTEERRDPSPTVPQTGNSG
ncbi:uncharacterized protein TM35_000551220, partial [Trypanosoma theileri]